MTQKTNQKQRLRAPSKRSLESRQKILDAAEQLFSQQGFDGASIRDIAKRAGVQGALVHHHGGSKEALFHTVVARRAEELAALRLDALRQCKAQGDPGLRDILSCFVVPFLDLVLDGGPAWNAYGRLIAHVSADERWRPITQACFDPTVEVFLGELRQVLPQAPPARLGAQFVFMVSAMLSVCASRWRIDALSDGTADGDIAQALLDFCEAGFRSAAE